MSESSAEISCDNCVAACCKAPIVMPLTQEEHDRHRRTMDFRVIRNPAKFAQRVPLPTEILQEPMRIPAGTGLYMLMSGCANLTDTNRCSIHADRPKCCRDYAVGSVACLRARRRAGLDADRPWTDVESAPAQVPDPTPSLVQQYFPQWSDEGKSSASTADAVAEIGPFDLPQLRMAVGRDSRWISERLSACETSLWSRRTRCAAWDIGALAAHLVTGLRTADAVLRAALEGHGAKSPAEFEGDRATTVRTFGPEADAVCVLLDRITPAAVSREVVIDDNEAVTTVQDLIEALVVELAVHGLDLADALGETRHLAPDAISTVARVLPTLLDPGTAPPPGTTYVLRSSAFELPLAWQRNAWRGQEGPNPCVIEGDPEAVLLYALGRMPFNKSSLVTNRPDLARAFKRHLVGP